MTDFEQNLHKYARLIVQVGVNVQQDQTLVVNGPLSAADFVRTVAQEAYEAGAKNVHVEWRDDQLLHIKYKHAPDHAFKEYPLWKAKGFEQMAEEGAAFLNIVAPNPDLFKDVDPERIATANKTAGEAMKTYQRYIQSDQVSWSVVAVPSPEWADKLFPDATETEKMTRLWEMIFEAVRVDQRDPVQAWKDHHEHLAQKVNELNENKYKQLHFRAPGTDLMIDLPDKHVWAGGGSTSGQGVAFVPNMPTEEVFTVPDKEGVNGVVRNSKPLNYGGTIIDDFSLTFEKGRITDYSAGEGYETLQRLIETDEGSHFLGEVALVPHDSPISNMDVIFYNTLFDENASSHLAIGSAYAFCIAGGKEMDEEQLEKEGANQSITHVDFMIGSAEMDVDGVRENGEREALFRNGNWVS